MSKNFRCWTGKSGAPRYSYKTLGIDRKRQEELAKGCKSGIYIDETLSKACRRFKFVESWILMSVKSDISFDRLEFTDKLGRICVGRTDFYGYIRMFYYNLDCLLRCEKELSKFIRAHGFECKSNTASLSGVHIEYEWNDNPDITDAMKEAENGRQSGELPAVFQWKNQEEWLVTMKLDDWIKLYTESRRNEI